MRVSKVVREYIEKTLRKSYEAALKKDTTIAEWENIFKQKEQLMEQMQEEMGQKVSAAFAALGFNGENFQVHIYERGWNNHPANKAAKERKESLLNQYHNAVSNILLELELGGATKKDLEDMLAKVTFGE